MSFIQFINTNGCKTNFKAYHSSDTFEIKLHDIKQWAACFLKQYASTSAVGVPPLNRKKLRYLYTTFSSNPCENDARS